MNERDFLILLGGAVLPSLLVSWLAAFVMRRVALRWGFVDRPHVARKIHKEPVPYGGGIAIWLGLVVPFAAGQAVLLLAAREDALAAAIRRWIPALAEAHLAGLAEQAPGLWILLGGGTVLMLIGLLDDVRGLDWRWRLALEFLVATVCVLWQGWRLTAFIDVPAVSWALSILWIVALINAFNMLDNMDALSAGVAALAAAMLAAVLLLSPDPETQRPQLFVAGFLLVLTGALLGFLGHNRPPARIFMGDAGAYLVGFSIGVATLLATYTNYRSSTPHAVLAPLCVMAVPLYDMVTVILIRCRAGRSPFAADKNHFSHRLVDLGLSRGQAVLTIYLTTATCGLAALLLHRVDFVGAVLIVLLILCVLLLIAILETTARRKIQQ